MIKARNRKLAMILVVAMLMTMFVGIGTASAATTYSAVGIPTIGTAANDYDLASIEVKIDQAMAVATGEQLTISLPNAITLSSRNVLVTSDDTLVSSTAYGAIVFVPDFLPGTTNTNAITTAMIPGTYIGSTKKSVEVVFSQKPHSGQGLFYVYLNKAGVSGASEDLVASLRSSGSAFPAGTVTLAQVVSGGGTVATIKSVKNVGTNGGEINTITLMETKRNTWEKGEKIKLKLPAGYSWKEPIIVAGTWAFRGMSSAGGQFTYDITESGRLLTIVLKDISGADTSQAARIDLAGGASGELVQIVVTDDSVAKQGEVLCTISGTNTSDQDLVIAKMGDYNAVIEEGVVQPCVAGWDTDLNKAQFKMIENLAGSLIKGRTVTLTLPDGAKWNTNQSNAVPFYRENHWPDLGLGASAPITFELEKGSDQYFTRNTDGISYTVSNNGRTLKYVVDDSSSSARTILFKKPQVSIRADFTGPLEVAVAGNAGVEGTVKIAEVSPSLTVTADSDAKVIIGAQNQVIGDITLTEGAAEAIDTSMGDRVALRLPLGTRWATKPTVEVTDGDVSIDAVSVNDETRELVITFKAASSKASTIKLSNVAITADRTVPEGPMKLYIATSSDALTDNSGEKFFNIDSISATIIGQCVTPAPTDVVNPGAAKGGEIKIGSGTIYVNGVAQASANPAIIKNDRALVAQRDLAAVLGAEIVWVEADQTVTLTKGDVVVVFTIGSTSYTVTKNGDTQTLTLPVAPELVNDYTMLPARYAAEAMGAIVTWDNNTRTVFITY